MSEEVFSRWQDTTIEKLQQENKQLRGVIKTKYDDLESKDKEIIELRNERDRLNKLLNSPAYRDVYVIKYQRDLYKEIIKKVRGIIESGLDFDNPQYADECKKELLQILDKVKEVK